MLLFILGFAVGAWFTRRAIRRKQRGNITFDIRRGL